MTLYRYGRITLYVDKTAQLQKLVETGRRYFLARPRRFWKSSKSSRGYPLRELRGGSALLSVLFSTTSSALPKMYINSTV